MILTGLLLPASGFADKKQKYLIRAGFIVTFLLLMSSFVLPTLIAPSDTGDIRGGAVSTSGQLSLILHQPLSYAGILMKNIFTRLPECFAGMEVFRLLGHLMVSKFPYFTYVYAVLVLLTDRPEPTVEPLRAKQHIGLFVCVAAAVALIFTALYLSFTEPGSSVIQGVQGRYFLPLLFPLYLALNSQMVQIRLRRAAFNRVILCISAFLLFAMAATNISLHCM